MDENRYRMRDLVDADFESLARMFTENDPERPISGEEVRQMFRWGDTPRFVRYRRAVVDSEASDELVGSGSLWQNSVMYHPKFAWSSVSVFPAYQHQGIGRRLFRDLEEEAKRLGLDGLWSGVRADLPRAVRFFEQAGFHEKRRQWTSRLDVTELPTNVPPRSPERWAREGIVFSTIQEDGPEKPEVRERLFRLYVEAMKDTPRMGGGVSSTLEEFSRTTFTGPGYLPETMFVARHGEEYVSFSLLYRHREGPEVLHVSLTGTRPEYRGRGLAGELKRRTIQYAQSHGYRYIDTDNDSQNERIWSINRQLGFRQFRVWISGEKLFPR